MSRRFRILSLDGGGAEGAFTASVLATLEQETGHSLVDHFELITGTSTGGILALGLALGLPASSLRDFYRDRGLELFPGTGLVPRTRDTSEHSHGALEAALRSLFKHQRLGEARCRLVIPTYDAVEGRIYLLKTAHHERFTGEYQASAVECALATSASPSSFFASASAPYPSSSYVDGGVWANCPVMVGVVEAVHFLGVALEQLDVLSIGTLGESFTTSSSRGRDEGTGWDSVLAESLLRGQAESALAQARLLTGGRVHRIDQVLSLGRLSLEDSRGLHELISLGEGEARKLEHLSEVQRRFLNGTRAEPFVPKHRLQVSAPG